MTQVLWFLALLALLLGWPLLWLAAVMVGEHAKTAAVLAKEAAHTFLWRVKHWHWR